MTQEPFAWCVIRGEDTQGCLFFLNEKAAMDYAMKMAKTLDEETLLEITPLYTKDQL